MLVDNVILHILTLTYLHDTIPVTAFIFFLPRRTGHKLLTTYCKVLPTCHPTDGGSSGTFSAATAGAVFSHGVGRVSVSVTHKRPRSRPGRATPLSSRRPNDRNGVPADRTSSPCGQHFLESLSESERVRSGAGRLIARDLCDAGESPRLSR